ncbi:MAG: hypothetical protein HY290_10200, partial [Planctomycetia bacterium]|nr:hypothetical protein [Planctomycetia bacterium]
MTSPVTATADATKPPRVRRWVPLSLRIFAVLLLFLGSGSVLWIGIPAYRQHLALEELTRVKANVQFLPHGPAWLRHRMGDKRMQPFDTVIGVHLHETGDADESLGSVRSLPELRILNLCRSNVTDEGLARIGNMKFLQLWLCNTSVTDAGLAHIGRLTRLRWLLLDGTQVTDGGLK